MELWTNPVFKSHGKVSGGQKYMYYNNKGEEVLLIYIPSTVKICTLIYIIFYKETTFNIVNEYQNLSFFLFEIWIHAIVGLHILLCINLTGWVNHSDLWQWSHLAHLRDITQIYASEGTLLITQIYGSEGTLLITLIYRISEGTLLISGTSLQFMAMKSSCSSQAHHSDLCKWRDLAHHSDLCKWRDLANLRDISQIYGSEGTLLITQIYGSEVTLLISGTSLRFMQLKGPCSSLRFMQVKGPCSSQGHHSDLWKWRDISHLRDIT